MQSDDTVAEAAEQSDAGAAAMTAASQSGRYKQLLTHSLTHRSTAAEVGEQVACTESVSYRCVRRSVGWMDIMMMYLYLYDAHTVD